MRNWKVLIPIGCLGMLVLAVVMCAGIAGAVFMSLKSSWPYTEGVNLASHNPVVVKELGEPIKGGWLVTGSVHITGPTGSAELSIPLTGPKKSGTLNVTAQRRDGEWKFERAVVAVHGSDLKIDLLKP
jgi:hypothetical protein